MKTTIPCPLCHALIAPKLGYHEMSLDDVFNIKQSSARSQKDDFLPPQLNMSMPESRDDVSVQLVDEDQSDHPDKGFVPYLNPSMLRVLLEKHIEELGEQILEREVLRSLDPTVFYNLWWYCLRFSLPFPLPILFQTDEETTSLNINSSFQQSTTEEQKEKPKHYCAFGSWDQSIATEGCKSGATCILSLLESLSNENSLPNNQKNVYRLPIQRIIESPSSANFLNENMMLSHFNLQTYTQSDWDQADLSKILVTLVEACDKRDFRPVLECVFRCNHQKIQKTKGQELLLLDAKKKSLHEQTTNNYTTSNDQDLFKSSGTQLDCYRTILYLAKYQCTTAFHVFFPATSKACKGYHFWCSIGAPLPIFDRLFRDALVRLKGDEHSGQLESLHFVSDAALGFRCTFGHIL